MAKINDNIEKVFFDEEQIKCRSIELARQIEVDYAQYTGVPLIVGLLKGSVPFMAELIKRFDFACEIDFMSVHSYEGTQSTGTVQIEKDMDQSCEGRPVLVVEDIIDTGRTIQSVKKLLKEKGASDIKVVSLLDKPSRRVVSMKPDYVGFTIPDVFVVGYGLDYNQKYRNLPYIGILKPEVYQ